MVNALLYDLLDLAAECTDRRTRRWLAASAVLLLCGNVAFFWMLGAAANGRWTTTAFALITTVMILFGAGLGLVSALASAVRAREGDLPAKWRWIAFATVLAIVVVPPPLALLGIFSLALIAQWRAANRPGADAARAQSRSTD